MFLFIGNLQIQLNKNNKKIRIINAFHAWVIRSISNYMSQTDTLTDTEDVPKNHNKLPIPYKDLLDSINFELWKDLSIWEIIDFLKKDRWIFNETNWRWDGFTFMYYDLHDKIKKDMNLDNLSKADIDLLKKL